jgi:hypothetical protein
MKAGNFIWNLQKKSYQDQTENKISKFWKFISSTQVRSSLSFTCDRSVVFFGFSSFLHEWKWPPRYNWNIVESDIEHHKPNDHDHDHGLLTWCSETSIKFITISFITTNVQSLIRPGNCSISQSHCLWFDPAGARTHDLPHPREHANHYTTDVVELLWLLVEWK